MTFMELIRRRGALFLGIFLLIFVVGLFYGLTVGGYNSVSRQAGKNGQPDNGKNASKIPALLATPDWKGVAMKVNGEKITDEQFLQMYDRMRQGSRMPGNSAEVDFDAYNYAAQYLTEQEIILAKARELKVEVTPAELTKQRADIAANYVSADEKKKGNFVSDLFSGLEKRKADKAAFSQYLQQNGLTEQQWEVEARRQLMVDNTRKKVQEEADKKLKASLEGTKKEIDDKLKAGSKFEDLAKQYNSEEDNKSSGGDMGWIGSGLLQKDTDFYAAQHKALFETAVGSVSDWVDVPAGWVKYEIYEKKSADGPDFEKGKQEIIDSLKKEHEADKSYKPSDAEVKERYEQVKARQIMLRSSAPDEFTKQIEEAKKAASYEYNSLYVLAYQALKDAKLQPPKEVKDTDLENLAKQAAIGASYDFQLIRDKLSAGQPGSKPGLVNPNGGGATSGVENKAAGADAEAPAEGGDASAPAEGGTTETPADPGHAWRWLGETALAQEPAETPAADPAADADAAAKVDIPQADIAGGQAAGGAPQIFNLAQTPIYALAIGLLKQAAQQEGATAGSTSHFLIAKTYSDWLDDEKMLKLQPIEREKARQEIEAELANVVQKDNYNAEAYAMRGLNLAWLDKKEDAYKQLDLAQKYAVQEEGPTWDMIKKAYEVFDDQAKLDKVNDMLAEFRQKKFQEMIEQAQAQAAAKQAQDDAQKKAQEGAPAGGGSTVPPEDAPAGNPPASAPPATAPPAGDK